ncbi:hydroxyneurosporene methyltransferase [Phormidium tenue FACHB-886]|nr:hydroxyneurosporene methyltransferase [Phormidium tenue FACHB-886]
MTVTLPSKPSTMEAKKKLFDMILAFVKSQCIYTATRLGVFDLLQDEGEQTLEWIAQRTATDPERLYFVLRALAHVEVLQEKPGRVFAPTELSDLLATGKSPSIGHLAMHLLEPAQWDAWKTLEEALHTGEVPFERANGTGVYEFCQDNAWSGDTFIKAMSFLTTHTVDPVLDVCDFSRFATVMDVGGGQGGLIARIVKRFGCQGMLFEVPYVAATAPAYLAQQGVDPEAIDIITGDVFEEIPTGADAIVMKYFLSAWNDEDAAKILHNCKKALPPHGRIILLQAFVPDLDEPKTAPDGIMPGIFAVQINVAVPGGGWRTRKHFQTLFEQCGFKLEGAVDSTTNLSAMEFSIAS